MARHSPFHSLFARRPSGLRKRKEGIVLGWPGDDLLSRALRHSTISAEAFNGRVRDGIGFRRLAQVTGPAKDNARASTKRPREGGELVTDAGKHGKWSYRHGPRTWTMRGIKPI